MAITLKDLALFHDFAEASITGGRAESIEQLARQWREAQSQPSDAASDLAAIERGLADANAGRVVAVAEAFAEAREAIGRGAP